MVNNTLESKHILHSGIFHPVLRLLQSPNVGISPHNLMYPLFIGTGKEVVEVPSMPGVHEYSVHNLRPSLEPLVAKGLRMVLLFGISGTMTKDETGSNADSAQNPVIQLLPKLRTWFPDVIVATDVCLCPYTNHGHCGIVNADGSLNNEASIARIAEIALAYAKAGAHVVAPSDMMDGRIGAIKSALRCAGLGSKVSVLSYSAKFASGFYGPFRDVTKSAPQFKDRKCYQLPPGSRGLAARAVKRDVEEGCDMLMVKPGLAYLDVVKQTKDAYPEYPLFVYQVSGEYAMLVHAARAGALELEAVLEEVLLSMRRAGADCIITYFAPLILERLLSKSKY